MRGVKGRILIVDDDTALSEMLGIVLRGEGFDPVSCGDGGPGAARIALIERDDLVLVGEQREGFDRAIIPAFYRRAQSTRRDCKQGEPLAVHFIVEPHP